MQCVLSVRQGIQFIIDCGHIAIFTKSEPQAVIFGDAAVCQSCVQIDHGFVVVSDLIQQEVVRICIVRMIELRGMIFAVRIRYQNMFFIACGILQNPEALDPFRCVSLDLNEFKFTSLDLVPENHALTFHRFMMCLLIC